MKINKKQIAIQSADVDLPQPKKKKKLPKWVMPVIIVLLVVILALCFYMLFYKPYTEKIKNNEAEIMETEDLITLQEVKLAEMIDMEEYLETAKDITSEICVYNNIKAEMKELNSIFEDTKNYTVSFGQAQGNNDDSNVRRDVTVSFTCKNYPTAFKVLEAIENSSKRSVLGNMSVSCNNMNSSTNEASMSLMFAYIETTDGSDDTKGINYPDAPAETSDEEEEE